MLFILRRVFSQSVLCFFLVSLLCLDATEIMASSAVETPANPYSHPSAVKYQTYQWDPTRVHHVMWEALKDCEGETMGQTEYRDKPGAECFAALIGSKHVVRLTEGTELCNELNNANFIVKTFLEKKIDFSNDGLTICLPVRSFFLTSSDGSKYTDLFILPKARGQCLVDSIFQNIHADCKGDIFWSVGRTLGIFQMYFMKDHGTHLTTAKHSDLHSGNIFYDRREIMGKDQWGISWIDCTQMNLQGDPLQDIGYIINHMEYLALNTSVQFSQAQYFQEKTLEGYTAGISQDIIRRLYGILDIPQSFEEKACQIPKLNSNKIDPKKCLRLIHQFFGRHLEKQSHKEKAEEAQPTPATPPVAEQQAATFAQTHSDGENLLLVANTVHS